MCTSTITAMRRTSRLGTMQQLNAPGCIGTRKMFQYLRRDLAPPSAVVQNPCDGSYVFRIDEQHDLMIQQWKTVYDKHVGRANTWEQFHLKYAEYEPGKHNAPTQCPSPEMLHARAQKCKDASAAGSDGFAPKELKALPPQAWRYRHQILELIKELRRYRKA